MNLKNLGQDLPIDLFAQAVKGLPPLPKTIRYEDDYDEKIRSVTVADTEESLTIYISGESSIVNFLRYSERVRQLLRVYLLLSLSELATISIKGKYQRFTEISAEDIELAASVEPIKFREIWSVYVAKYSSSSLLVLRALLIFLCNIRFMFWSTSYREFISKVLVVDTPSPYAVVRSGEAFLTIEEEAKLVRWFDGAAFRVADLPLSEIEMACLLVSSNQFGMRPKQLGVIRTRNCTVRPSPEDGSANIHLAFRIIKQKDPALALAPLIRKVKREWAPLFVRLMEFKQSLGPDEFLFGFNSRWELSKALSDQLERILPDSPRRIAYDLRHSMAQRLVDAGSSQEDLASALGQTNLASGLVYFRQSANQAELVNKALGISEIFIAVANLAKSRFISEEELARLKGDQQIAGAPHGIPVAGIGGCETGQPSCPYNPITACYGCDKFMPVRNLELHRHVLAEMRGVVIQFKDVSHGEVSSPAYLQLRRTISEIQAVILDLEGGSHE
jgi:hypothetical protein